MCLLIFTSVAETAAEAAQMEKLHDALKAASLNGGATTHLVRLVKETFEKRRAWISGLPADSTPSRITQEYPHLQHAELVSFIPLIFPSGILLSFETC